MKKTLTAFVFLSCFGIAKGQAQRLEGRAIAAFGSSYCGIPDGITVGSDESSTIGKNQFHPSYAFGVGAQYFLKKHWSVGLDFMYSREGQKTHYTDFLNDFTNEAQTSYFRIPLNIAYYFRSPDAKLRPYLVTGVSLGFLTSQDESFTPNNDYTSNYFHKEGIPVMGFKSTDFGLQLGGGIRYRINKHSTVFAEVKYYRGVVGPYLNGFPDTRNENIRMQVGYAYCLK